MKKFKKLIAVALAAVMVLAMLTGCDALAGGSSREDNALNLLNQARVNTYGLSELYRSEEADAHAKELAAFLQKYYEGNYANSDAVLNQKVSDLMNTYADGNYFKGLFISPDGDTLSATSFVNKEVATDSSATCAGVASTTAYNHPILVILIY